MKRDIQLLWQQYQSEPSIDNRNAIIEASMPLIYAIARRVQSRFGDRGHSVEDLVGQSVISLINAIDRFSEDRNTPFNKYISLRIACGAMDAYRDGTPGSRVLKRRTGVVTRIMDDHFKKHGYKMSYDDAVAKMKSLEGTTRIRTVPTGKQTLRVRRDDEDNVLCDYAKKQFEKSDLDNTINYYTRMLDDKDKAILTMIFMEGYNQSDVAKIMGLSPSTVSQHMKNTIRQMRCRIRDQAA